MLPARVAYETIWAPYLLLRQLSVLIEPPMGLRTLPRATDLILLALLNTRSNGPHCSLRLSPRINPSYASWAGPSFHENEMKFLHTGKLCSGTRGSNSRLSSSSGGSPPSFPLPPPPPPPDTV